MKRVIEYYEFPNGEIVKSIKPEGVYRFDPITKAWKTDPSLTAEFTWDRPYGRPCPDLRQKIDVSCDLPPFPHEGEFKPGRTVLIGAFPQQSAHDFSPIEWIVLDVDGSSALCISKYCLITSGYCDAEKTYGKKELLRWETSLAREICNHHFFDSAFSDAEKARILPRKTANVQFGTECQDRVFLLSEEEVRRYFPTASQRKGMPTPHATLKGARMGWTDDTKAFTSWWILPQEVGTFVYPKAVFQMGEIQFHGRNAYHSDFTIRPCIQIKYKYD